MQQRQAVLRLTPEEQFRIEDRLTGDNAIEALDALEQIEDLQGAIRLVEDWAPSSDDFDYELSCLGAALAVGEVSAEARIEIELAVKGIQRTVTNRVADYERWLKRKEVEELL